MDLHLRTGIGEKHHSERVHHSIETTDALEEYKRYSELIARFIENLLDNGNFRLFVLNDVALIVVHFCLTVDYRDGNGRHAPRDIIHSSMTIFNNLTATPIN